MNSPYAKTLLDLNASLFNKKQESNLHNIFVVSKSSRIDNMGSLDSFFVRFNQSNEFAKSKDIASKKYICALFKRNFDYLEGNAVIPISQKYKRVYECLIFQKLQPDLYEFILSDIRRGEEFGFTRSGFDRDKKLRIKLKKSLFGTNITFQTPWYHPHQQDNETGIMEPINHTTFDPKTGKYNRGLLVINKYSFFVDDDDLDRLLELSIEHYKIRVLPYLTNSQKQG